MVVWFGGCSSEVKKKNRQPVVVETMTLRPRDNSCADRFVGNIEEASAAALSFAVGGQVKRIWVTLPKLH